MEEEVDFSTKNKGIPVLEEGSVKHIIDKIVALHEFTAEYEEWRQLCQLWDPKLGTFGFELAPELQSFVWRNGE